MNTSDKGNIAEALALAELVKRGYSEEQIRKIWGGNIMRVFTKVLEVSKDLQNS